MIQAFSVLEEIKDRLAEAKSIYYQGESWIPLRYNDDKLIADLFGGKAYRPLSDVERIIYNDKTKTALVIWKV